MMQDLVAATLHGCGRINRCGINSWIISIRGMDYLEMEATIA